MEKRHIEELEGKIKKLQTALTSISVSDDLDEFWRLIHSPPFTSVAEGIFVSGLVDSMIEQLEVFANMRSMLLTASRKVDK